MKRPDQFATTRWDDPFWHVVRMLVDETRGRVPSGRGSIVTALAKSNNEAVGGLLRYLKAHPDLLDRVVSYVEFRRDAAERLLARARTEAQALEDFAHISEEVVARYGTKSPDHHQSSKVVVKTVEVLTEAVCLEQGLNVNVNPQKRASIVSDNHIWTSPRRLDGALPSLLNPVGLWEIKEYWGGTAGGSKMSDAIYECQLVGTELRAFEDSGGPRVLHYAIFDGAQQWAVRRSDLRRAVDLLCSGLLDGLFVGTDIIDLWPGIVRELCELVPRT